MKKIFIVVTSIVAMSASAPAFAEDPVSWTGLFIGTDIGYSTGDARVHIPNYPSTFDLEADGLIGGIRAGYNYQEDNLVVGIDGSLYLSDVSGKHASGLDSELYKLKEDDPNGSLGIRIGYAVDKALVFVRSGWAFTKLKTWYDPLAGGVDTEDVDGWTVGGGIEYAITDRLSTHVEYRYTEYNRERFFHNGPSTVDYSPNEFLFGFSYNLGS